MLIEMKNVNEMKKVLITVGTTSNLASICLIVLMLYKRGSSGDHLLLPGRSKSLKVKFFQNKVKKFQCSGIRSKIENTVN